MTWYNDWKPVVFLSVIRNGICTLNRGTPNKHLHSPTKFIVGEKEKVCIRLFEFISKVS